MVLGATVKRNQEAAGLGDLNAMINDVNARAHRPRITSSEARGQALQSIFGGIGAGVAVSAVMAYLGAPYIIETGAVVAAVAGGSVMFVRSMLDELLDAGKLRGIYDTAKRVVEEKTKRIKALCEELDRYEALWLTEQRAHADTKHLLSLSRVEIAQLRDQLGKRSSYVAPAQAAPPVVTDANRLLSNYYSTGEWTSRRKAAEPPLSWTAERYREACDILRDAGIIVSRNTRTDVTTVDLATATEQLNNYLLRVDTNRPPVERQIEEEGDDYDR